LGHRALAEVALQSFPAELNQLVLHLSSEEDRLIPFLDKICPALFLLLA
jgi:hypothetical protein